MVAFWELWQQLGFPWQLSWRQKYFGKGLQVPQKAGMGLQVPRKAAAGLQVSQKPFYMATSPLLWHMEGAGKRKGEKRKSTFAGRKQPIQPNPHLGSNSLGVARDASHPKPKWKDIPLSNFDLLK